MRLDYAIIDVFAETCFGGNPLAVVWSNETLDDILMQRIAAEFNLAETIFLSPPIHPENHALARIFTPETELPFAGHPTVGASYAIGTAGRIFGKPARNRLRLEEKVGLVTAELIEADGRVCGARVASPEPLEIGQSFAPALIAATLSLPEDAISCKTHPPQLVTCGNSLIYVALADRQALGRAAPNPEMFRDHVPRELAIGVHLYIRSDRDDVDLEARMFAPMVGIPEDPATGAANLSLTGLLASLDPAPDADLSYRITQGAQMGRPSLLIGSARKRDAALSDFWIGGSCADVGQGILTLPDQPPKM